MKKDIIAENLVQDDLIFILPLITSIVIFSREMLVHCKMVRAEKSTIYHIEKLPNFVQRNIKDKFDLSTDNINEEIAECISIFKNTIERIPHISTSSFYNNLKPELIETVGMSKLDSFYGCYFPLTDKIIVDEHDIRRSIFHELLHLASNKRYCEKYYSGFRQFMVEGLEGKEYVKYSIGSGLNEAYTELLTQRYFRNEGCARSYKMIIDFAYHIEILVGRELMERLYFDADLYSLMDRLSEYSSYDEVEKLIKKIDHFYDATYESVMLIPKYMVKNTYKEIILMLAKMYLRKINFSIRDDRESVSFLIDSFESLIDLKKNNIFSYSLNSREYLKIKQVMNKEFKKI